MYEKLRTNKSIQWFIIHLRYLLGVAFIPSGLTKLVGDRFTQNFGQCQGIYQAGFYYNFIGFVQILAGFLLMTQRLASIGILVYYCLIVNIWIITISLSFQGTWIITSLMTFASTVLLVWDYQKFKSIFSYNTILVIKQYSDPSRYWQILGLLYFVLILSMFLFKFNSNSNIAGTVVFFILLIIIVSNIIAYRKYKKQK